jgi:hypothetical protein
MHALLLSLALGQAAPALPPAAAPPAEPAPATATTPAAPPQPAEDGRRLRSIDFARLPDGSFRAALDGQPVVGADFYRAVLRPDLASRAEEARFQRTALFIAAGVAPVAGLGIGWVVGTAHQWPLPPCVGEPPGPVDCRAHDQVAKQNQSAMTTALVAGGVAGLATGVVAWLLGSAIHPLEPTADEAEALARAYRARALPAPATAPAAGGASLRLEAGPRAARLALRVAF